MVTPAFADDDSCTPAEVQAALNQNINDFISSAGNLLPNSNQIKNQLNTLAGDLVNSGLNQDQLDKVNEYFAAAEQKIAEVKKLGNEFDNSGPALTDYFLQVAELHKGLLQDSKNPENPFSTQDYMRDFDFLKTETNNFLQSLNTQVEPSQVGAKFDPRQFLDKGVTIPTQKPLELDIIGLGVDGRFAVQNVVSMVHKFRGKFGDSQLNEDLTFFLNVFPQSAEQILMEANVPSSQTVFNTLGNLGTGQSFVVDAFGVVKPKNSSNSGSENVFISSAVDQSFNSRIFGGSDGLKPQIKIASRDREFLLADHVFTSPIVLDMNGDGELEASNGQWKPHDYSNSPIVEFDINGDGFDELIEWVGKNDGLLIIYREGEEVNGKNLFGEASGFVDGYENLSAYDQNNDSVLNGEEIKNFSVWQDKNSNAKVDKGEVKSVTELGITEFGVTHKGLVSSFKQNNQTKTMWDWYPCVFRVKRTL